MIYNKLNLPEWAIECFKQHQYLPENYYEASWFLNDAVLELGSHKEFLVTYKKNTKSINAREYHTILDEKNCLDIFYAPIWNSCDMITKANCVKWTYEYFENLFHTKHYALSFLELSGNNNYFGAHDQVNGALFVNIDQTAANVLQLLIHEMTHAKQYKSLDTYYASKKHDSENWNLWDTNLLYNTGSDFIRRSKNFNSAIPYKQVLLAVNLKELGADNKALKIRNSIEKMLQEKFGTSKIHREDKENTDQKNKNRMNSFLRLGNMEVGKLNWLVIISKECQQVFAKLEARMQKKQNEYNLEKEKLTTILSAPISEKAKQKEITKTNSNLTSLQKEMDETKKKLLKVQKMYKEAREWIHVVFDHKLSKAENTQVLAFINGESI